jgi:hypothetical protein
MPLRLVTILLAALFAMPAHSQEKEAVVFDIRRPVALDPAKRPEKDYFINAGSEFGLKQDMIVVVTRRQTLYDAYQNKSPGDLIVPVAQIRIIHVQKGLSVARIEKMVDRTGLPNLDLDAILVGDRLDMETARMTKHKTAEVSFEQTLTPLETGLPSSSSADFSSMSAPSVANPQQTL